MSTPNINWKQLKQTLAEAKQIVITSHQSPDGDAVGSALALHNYFKKIGQKSYVILPDAFPDFYQWMPSSEDVLFYDKATEKSEEILATSDVFFALDYNDLKRIGTHFMGAVSKHNFTRVMIDHHPNPANFADITYSRPEICSTAQLIFEFIEHLDDLDKIDAEIGACIYCGLMTDTGSFRFSSVDNRTHEIAAVLIKKGVQQNKIHENVYDQNSLDRIRLQGHVFSNRLEYLKDLGVAIISLTKEDGQKFNVQSGDTEGFVNIALSIKNTKLAVFFREDDEKVKISFRSKGDVKANAIAAEHFNGGGHQNAAGGRAGLPMNKAIEQFKDVVKNYI